MLTARASLIQRDWNVKKDAAESYDVFEMDLSTMLSSFNALYLTGPVAGHATYHPALPDAFVPSMVLPAGGYTDLTIGVKNTYNQEKANYDRELKTITDLRNTHDIKCGLCTSYLSSMFKQESVCNKFLFGIKKAGIAANVDAGEIFFRMVAHITLAYAPNKATDAAPLLLRLASADFHDGRGIEINVSEFFEAFDHLAEMNASPVPMVMQRNISSAGKLFPNFVSKLCALREANETDAIALVAGTALPAIPRWRTMLEQCVLDARAYEECDYISKGTAAGYETKTQPKESRTNYVYDPKAPWCGTCGRIGHTADKCTAKKCICHKPIVNGKRDHSVSDRDHDKARREYIPFKDRNPTDSQRNRKEGDRDLSRNNPKKAQAPGEKKLAQQLKENDKHNVKMTKFINEGKRLVDQNKVLRAAIESSTDTSLSKSMALIPYVPSQVFKSSSSRRSRNKRGRDDEESE